MAERMGRRQREHMNEMLAAMRRFEWDMHDAVGRAGRLPDGWRAAWEGKSSPKERVTLRVDRDVLRFFKSMGAGYGPRMNDVLRSFMLARLAGLIEHGDLAGRWHETWMGKPRPSRVERLRRMERMLHLMDRSEALLQARQARGHMAPAEIAEMRMILGELESLGKAEGQEKGGPNGPPVSLG